ADSIVLNGSSRDEAVLVSAGGIPTTIAVLGLAPFVTITGSDGVTDHLAVNTLGGNDHGGASGLNPGLIRLTGDLGDGQVPPPQIAGITINGGAPQRGPVTQNPVAFHQPIPVFSAPPP